MRDASAQPCLPPSLRLAIFELVESRAAKWMLPSDSCNYYRQRRNLNVSMFIKFKLVFSWDDSYVFAQKRMLLANWLKMWFLVEVLIGYPMDPWVRRNQYIQCFQVALIQVPKITEKKFWLKILIPGKVKTLEVFNNFKCCQFMIHNVLKFFCNKLWVLGDEEFTSLKLWAIPSFLLKKVGIIWRPVFCY